MKFTEATLGRVFIVRLEDGDVLHECVEQLALEKNIKRASLIALGGADSGSKLVVGPEKGRGAIPANPMEIILDDVYEIAGVGTIFPDSKDKPVLHMHIAAIRGKEARGGCVRRGVKTWHVLEIVIFELLNASSRRVLEEASGFELLQP
jgi:predicted DNA-binding protein with PD1-like motif